MKKSCLTTLIVAWLLFSITGLINGQTKFNGFAINPKFGLYGSFCGGLPGSVGGMELNVLRNKWMFSLDYFHSKFTFIGDKEELLDQFDFLFGRYFGNESWNIRFQIQGGVGTLKGITYNESEHISTIGLPLKLGLKWLPTSSLGVGVDLQAKLNSKYSIYMIMASIEIGKLRNK
ncbi:MAG TPA: hypothetical protein DCZ51_03405 [Bacteroidales bacterium]|jgi:hypothetical protein|nr:hypothetical protein [Bacteroidales bacterium]